jgi:hypothetical protein
VDIKIPNIAMPIFLVLYLCRIHFRYMNISTLALKLIMLLFPGLIAALIYRRLTVKHKERSDFMFTLIAITEGMFSYLALQTIYFLGVFIYNFFATSPLTYGVLETFKDLSNSNVIPYSEIMMASGIAIVFGLITVKVSHDNLLNRYAAKWGISNKYGDENLYSNFLNDDDIDWIYVRDIPNKLVYLGAVQSFSESMDFKELVLNDVTVFTFPECEELYEVRKIYLCLPKDKIIIEQANLIMK